MSVSFGCDVRIKSAPRLAPCLCAQMSGYFADAVSEGPEAFLGPLSEAADPHCGLCYGAGVETMPGEDPAEFNLHVGDGASLLAALGFGPELYGSCDLPTARRALMRARNVNLEPFTREEDVRYGAPRCDENGAVELRPIRYFSAEFSAESLRDRIAMWADLLEVATARGATSLNWG